MDYCCVRGRQHDSQGGPAGIVLADGAADRIDVTGTRPAAAGDFIPVDGLLLRPAEGRKQQAENQGQFFIFHLISVLPLISAFVPRGRGRVRP